MTTPPLHTFQDGSTLKIMNMKELLTIPIWKGNRILDKEHVAKIKASVGSNIQRLDSGYRIIKYNEVSTDNELVEQSYIIDGQHRLSVIRDHLNTSQMPLQDFQVVVTERTVSSELDAIQYFNEVNMVKPQCWTADPNLIVNLYMVALEKVFNTRKSQLIRKGNAHRPFLSSDKLRERLQKIPGLKFSSEYINAFVDRVTAYNMLLKKKYQDRATLDQDDKFIKKANALGFYLALDLKLGWVDELLGGD